MKKIILFNIVCLFVLLSSFYSSTNSPMDEIINAVKKSNTTIIATYFDNTVELALPDKNDSYNKAQAELVLKDFFSINTVKNFIVDHKGDNNGAAYCIGTLTTQKANYRLTVYMKNKAGKNVVQEMRIEYKR